MRIFSGQPAAKMVERFPTRGQSFSAVESRARKIINHVRRGGDKVLRQYAERWDSLGPKQSFSVSAMEMQSAWESLNPNLRSSLECAAANIRQFCDWQKPDCWTRTQDGISLGQILKPLQSVGCYVPGGRYPLVSTVLMTVIPAQVAGVKNICVVSPKPSPEVLAAAAMLRITKVFRIGGAQAVAALAYGTETIARVDKIVGPGNAFVTAAKKLIAFDCAIDFLAGPTESLILAETGNPEFIAADLVAQAEHDTQSRACFITTSKKLATAVSLSLDRLSRGNSTAREALRKSGAILVAKSRQQARDWANRIAPEHITVAADDLPFIENAGSIFVGDYSAQAAGDYASGPNHVLPTSGQARFRGGLSVLDFVKIITVQELSSAGLQRLASAIECLAAAEGLPAHANSVRVRCASA
jgi:histidinol dehydrogenase